MPRTWSILCEPAYTLDGDFSVTVELLDHVDFDWHLASGHDNRIAGELRFASPKPK